MDSRRRAVAAREEAIGISMVGVSPSNNALHHDLGFHPVEAFASIEVEQGEELLDLLPVPHISVPYLKSIRGSDRHANSSSTQT